MTGTKQLPLCIKMPLYCRQSNHSNTKWLEFQFFSILLFAFQITGSLINLIRRQKERKKLVEFMQHCSHILYFPCVSAYYLCSPHFPCVVHILPVLSMLSHALSYSPHGIQCSPLFSLPYLMFSSLIPLLSHVLPMLSHSL